LRKLFSSVVFLLYGLSNLGGTYFYVLSNSKGDLS